MAEIISVTSLLAQCSWLPGMLFKDDQSYYHAYVPALDITGYGSTKVEAKSSLEVVMKEYFEKLMKERGLYKDLKKNGWDIGPHDVIPPDITTKGEDVLHWVKSGTYVYKIGCQVLWPEGDFGG